MKRALTLLIISTLTLGLNAQSWMNIHHSYEGTDWKLPLRMDDCDAVDFDQSEGILRYATNTDTETPFALGYPLADIDSITLAAPLTDDEKGHNRHRIFSMHITTLDHTPIIEKEEWTNCHIAIDGMGEYSDYSGTGRIRGRGNSSWIHYDKKPYKFKLDSKSKLLGMGKAKNWNLLSNYRDPTDMLNVFAFETARYMGMPYPNSTRFVEVFLNGEYVGVYQLTEKIEIGENRVDISKDGGVLLGIDLDDGPSLSPSATDNFWSKIYSLPMCVKEPEDAPRDLIDSIRDDFARVEDAIYRHDYATLDSLLDIPSFIKILQMHEYLFNVEIDAPRSIYVHKDVGGKYTFGPAWDWDAAYDFNWTNWEQGHHYFDSPEKLIYGKSPETASNGNYYTINAFWRDMFGSAPFVTQYKQTWAELSGDIVATPWAETQLYIDNMHSSGAYDRDTERWPLYTQYTDWWGTPTYTETFFPDDELERMYDWLITRKAYLDKVIKQYPAGTDIVREPDSSSDSYEVRDGAIYITKSVTFANGYDQLGRIDIDEDDILSMLGGEPVSLVPMNSNGKAGTNTASGTYGAWFDDNGTNYWQYAHVYIESNELYSWAYGCHPDNCYTGDEHTVWMQYRKGLKKANVYITFVVK